MKDKKLILALIAFVAVVGIMVGIWYASRPQSAPRDDKDDTQATTASGDHTQQPTTEGGDTVQTPTGYAHHFTLEVLHADGTVNTIQIQTNEDYLGDALKAEGLAAESNSPGLYDMVDGEKAVWSENQAYWNFLINGEVAMVGMNDTPIQDGDVYRLEYTLG